VSSEPPCLSGDPLDPLTPLPPSLTSLRPLADGELTEAWNLYYAEAKSSMLAAIRSLKSYRPPATTRPHTSSLNKQRTIVILDYFSGRTAPGHAVAKMLVHSGGKEEIKVHHITFDLLDLPSLAGGGTHQHVKGDLFGLDDKCVDELMAKFPAHAEVSGGRGD
jgi:hypothetical protein